MKTYPKIPTIYRRDPETAYKTLVEGVYATPTLDYLAGLQWLWTEKVDGMNIRVWHALGKMCFGGRTDRAQLPVNLVNHLNDTFSVEKMEAAGLGEGMILYGEGYGAGIQKGGGYRKDQAFILFDVYWAEGELWLTFDDMVDIARKLEIPRAPVVGIGTLPDAVNYVKNKPFSTVAEDMRLMEGVVVRPREYLLTRTGQRVIAKVKCKDFPNV